MDWILARLAEPSTWAGLAVIATAVGQAFPVAAPITMPLAGVCGVIATARKG
jgi:hypothetical protein